MCCGLKLWVSLLFSSYVCAFNTFLLLQQKSSDNTRANNARELFRTPQDVSDFAATYFTPAQINAAALPPNTSLHAFCMALCGPALSYAQRRQAFTPGDWLPPGIDVSKIQMNR
jgi:hypothetical protein